MKRITLAAIVAVALTTLAFAHDTWVQSNIPVIRVGDVAYVDLMLGNHGNHHRDFKLFGKVNLDAITLAVIAPDGSATDLKPALVDFGSAPKEGYYSARVRLDQPGLHMIAHTSDAVVSYAPARSIKSGKTFILASHSLDTLPAHISGFDRVLGHPLELVPRISPAPLAAGTPITVRLLYKNKPLADTVVSFIPRGHTLAEHFDPDFERRTDADGLATFTPREANQYLIVAHHADTDSGEGYEQTKYSATLTLTVQPAPSRNTN